VATDVERRTYSVKEAAALLGVSKSKVYMSVRNGEMRAVQLGRRVVIPCDVIEALVGPITVDDRDQGWSAEPSTHNVPRPIPAKKGAEMNAVHLTGTITRPPELRLSRSRLEVCTLQLAVPRRRRDGEERGAIHVDVVAFGTVAVAASELGQGDRVAVSGRLGQRQWTSSNGSQHARFEVVADDVESLTLTGITEAS
jgi:excisionase family DNA binding protein